MRFRYLAFILVAINVVIFILQMLIDPLTDIFVLYSPDILARPWILVTSMFLHGGIEHLLYNMFALALFGSILEKVVGSKKFIILYFVGGIAAGIGSSFLYTASLGASGAIFAILGTLAVLRPRMAIYFGYVPMPMVMAAGLWALIDLFGLLFPSDVANAAHLTGLFFGIVAGFYLRKEYGEKAVKRKIGKVENIEEWEDEWLS